MLDIDIAMGVLRDLFSTLGQVITTVFWALIHAIKSPKPKSVVGEIVLITGAGSEEGIGRRLALQFAQLSAILVLWDIDENGLKTTAEECRSHGATVYTYVVDLRNRDAVYKTADQVKQEVGEVGILVNNAGVVNGTDFMKTSDQAIENVFRVNCFGTFWCIKAFMPMMMERNHGHIVNIASSAGLCAVNQLSDYCATKFALIGFSESLYLEIQLGGYNNLHLTTVCPYMINTGMFAGCRTKFPLLLPMLNPESTSRRILKAILTNETVVVMPWIINMMVLARTFLPLQTWWVIYRFLGGADVMKTFTGRNNSNVPQKIDSTTV